MQKLLLPFGITLAALGLIHLTKPAAPQAGGPPQPPAPGPLPGVPPIVPPVGPAQPGAPTANVDVLRQELGTLLTQATVAPGSVKPESLDALAAELDRAGLTAEAAQVRAKSAELKAQIPVL